VVIDRSGLRGLSFATSRTEASETRRRRSTVDHRTSVDQRASVDSKPDLATPPRLFNESRVEARPSDEAIWCDVHVGPIGSVRRPRAKARFVVFSNGDEYESVAPRKAALVSSPLVLEWTDLPHSLQRGNVLALEYLSDAFSSRFRSPDRKTSSASERMTLRPRQDARIVVAFLQDARPAWLDPRCVSILGTSWKASRLPLAATA
jgi:hypothetical protein